MNRKSMSNNTWQRHRSKPGRVFFIALAIVLLSSALASFSTASSAGSVQVALPTFNVTLNGTRVDSLNREYPLIVYKGITYFPMTYYDCRYLGLQTRWTAQTGLEINSTGVSGLYRDYRRSTPNDRSFTAAIVTNPVRLNGAYIDNAKEEYPLLIFRGLTYFPMTWRFCVDGFKWGYTFSMSGGLVINSANRAAAALNIQTPTEYNELTEDYIAFTVANGKYYISGNDGKIFQGSLSDPGQRKVVYQLPDDAKNVWGYSPATLYTLNNQVYLNVTTRIMENEFDIRIFDDGSWVEADRDWVDFGDNSVRVIHTPAPANGNMSIRYGNGNPISVGEPGFLYGWKWVQDASGSSGSYSYDLYLIGDDIYVLAFDRRSVASASGVTTGIYKVNINTNATTRVVDAQVLNFKIDGNTIYYINQSDYRIYSVPLAGGTPRALTNAVSSGTVINELFDFAVLNGKVYYITETYGTTAEGISKYRLNRTGDSEPINDGGEARRVWLQNGYICATFDSANGSAYRMMVFDTAGNVVFKTSDIILLDTVTVDNGRLYYVESETRLVGMAQLQ